MKPFFKFYILIWSTACFIGLCLFLKRRQSYGIARAAYWRFIFKPWRITTFAIALSGMMGIAPYSGDPTWDYVDAFFMSVLTYLTAPWAVGAIFNAFRGKLNPA